MAIWGQWFIGVKQEKAYIPSIFFLYKSMKCESACVIGDIFGIETGTNSPLVKPLIHRI